MHTWVEARTNTASLPAPGAGVPPNLGITSEQEFHRAPEDAGTPALKLPEREHLLPLLAHGAPPLILAAEATQANARAARRSHLGEGMPHPTHRGCVGIRPFMISTDAPFLSPIPAICLLHPKGTRHVQA